MKITWLGHSCFMVESSNGSVVFDPYSPDYVPGLKLPPLTADACICSHGHNDHNYAKGVKLSGMTPAFTVTKLESFHDGNAGKLRGGNTITAVDAEGLRLVHLGDLGQVLNMEQIKALGKVDVLFIPVGGYYTIDASEAAMIASLLRPRIVFPMHYRGNGFGYDVLSTVENFAKLCGNVKRFDTNEIEISTDTEPMTAVLSCPVK